MKKLNYSIIYFSPSDLFDQLVSSSLFIVLVSFRGIETQKYKLELQKKIGKNYEKKKNHTDDDVDESANDENKIIQIFNDTESDCSYVCNDIKYMDASEIENDNDYDNENDNENDDDNDNDNDYDNDNENNYDNDNGSQDEREHNRVHKKMIRNRRNVSLEKNEDKNEVIELEKKYNKQRSLNHRNFTDENLEEIKQKIFPELQKYLIKKFSLSHQTVATQTSNDENIENLNYNFPTATTLSKFVKTQEDE